MVTNINKKQLMFLFLIALPVNCIGTLSDNWPDKNEDNWNTFDKIDSDLDSIKCNDIFGNCDMTEDIGNNFNKKNLKRSDAGESYYHTMDLTPCTCGMDYHLMDLGNKYFPRYALTGKCKTNSCGKFYQCTEKHYEVRVLRQKEIDLRKRDRVSLNPKEFWDIEVIKVVVACVCIPSV